ncbi:MAG: hypothetical protein CMJ64_21940 [Planctomycetaceae bacterium]|nr:hypothetical protein [Planctomycetaceae bacterium]
MVGIELLYGLVAGCLLLVHCGVLSRAAYRSGCANSRLGWRSATRVVLTSTWAGLLVIAIVYRAPLWRWDFEMFEVVRWLSTLPAVIATFFGAWALRSRLEVDSSGEMIAEGAYRWCRYPYDGAMGIFILGLGVFISNYLVLAASILVFFAMRLLVPWEQEKRRRREFGAGYLAYAADSGVFLPSVEAVPQKEYTVPQRFGMAAILGLLTTLAIIFGALNYAQAPPAVYLFVGSEIVGICLAQIFLGSAPRGGSALTGAVLLPFWAYVMLDIPRLDPFEHLAILASLLTLGALIGYCIGALAAGFFLAIDLIESLVTVDADPALATPAVVEDAPLHEPEPTHFKELKTRIVNRT